MVLTPLQIPVRVPKGDEQVTLRCFAERHLQGGIGRSSSGGAQSFGHFRLNLFWQSDMV